METINILFDMACGAASATFGTALGVIASALMMNPLMGVAILIPTIYLAGMVGGVIVGSLIRNFAKIRHTEILVFTTGSVRYEQ